MGLLRVIIALLFIASYSAQALAQNSDIQAAIDTPAEQKQTIDDIPDADISVNPPISYDLPDYPEEAKYSLGQMQTYIINEEDTLMDIARSYNLGYIELLSANDLMDSWAPPPGKEIKLPLQHLLPRAEQTGIIINLGEMRLFYFMDGGRVETFPIGIGREGLQTPLGKTTIVKKVAHPSWYPTKRMRDANPDLPVRVPPGTGNPLGEYALYLGWAEFRIHGTTKPWGIGRRVSSGCIRMYPEAIEGIFPEVPVGTKVEVVDQPVKIAWLGKALYMEAHPSRIQSDAIEKSDFIPDEFLDTEIPADLKTFIIKTVGEYESKINWEQIQAILQKRQGYPIKILDIDIVKDEE